MRGALLGICRVERQQDLSGAHISTHIMGIVEHKTVSLPFVRTETVIFTAGKASCLPLQ